MHINYLTRIRRNILEVKKLVILPFRNMKRSVNHIAVCQMTSTTDKAFNLCAVTDMVKNAAKEHVQMIFFPEGCDFIPENKLEVLDKAEPIIGGYIMNSYRKLAVKYNVWLSMGGVHEKDENNPTKIYNTHVIINNKGNIVQTYRKLHMFDVDIPEKNFRVMESDYVTGGSHIVAPVDTPVGMVGLGVCYDLRFPELSTQLAMFGAELLTYPSAFTTATGPDHWETLIRARAIENECFVVAAAQVGRHSSHRSSYGHAMCADPWGSVLADCGVDVGYCVVEVKLPRIKETRKHMPVFQHRRADVYSLYALSLRAAPLPEHTEPGDRADEVATDRTAEEAPSGARTYHFGQVKIPESCVFYTTELSYAFVNLRCVTPGHVLVAPIRAAQRNKDLTDQEANDFFGAIRTVQRLMEKVHNTESCTVTIQDGVDAGQTIKHLHCHIMPRKKGDFIQNDLIYLELAKHDQLTSGHPAKPARTLQEMEAEAQELRSQLNNMDSSNQGEES